MQPYAVEERRRRAANVGDHGVTGLLECQAHGRGDAASVGRDSLCRKTPPGASIAAMLLIASINSPSSK